MSFTSWAYLLYLPLIFAAYWLVPVRRLRKVLLLVASFFFYGYLQPRLCLLLLVASLAAYAGALLLEKLPSRRGWWLWLCLAALLGLLGFFKYTQFMAGLLQDVGGWLTTAGELAQRCSDAAVWLEETLRGAYRWLGLEAEGSKLLPPLGISFFTFQCVGYLVDVSRGSCRAERNPLDVLLFVSFFPQLVAGPIERAGHLLPQLQNTAQQFSLAHLQAGLPLLLRGLLKKTVLADNLAPLADKVFYLDAPSGALLYAGALAFALQIYGDFSGYTDIARGSARLFGVDLMENFRAPYAALTPADFWRRWHISFSLWIRDYLYVPLGGSRKGGLPRLLPVLLATFGLSGLWHGAAWHFVAWGLYFGVLVWLCHLAGIHRNDWRPQGGSAVTRFLKTAACRLGTFHLILLGWLLFRAPGLDWLLDALHKMPAPSPEIWRTALIIGGACAFYALPLAGWWWAERLRTPWLRGAGYALLFCWLLVFGKGTEYSFIYFRF